MDISPNSENEGSECSYNYLTVYEGEDDDGNVLSQMCGSKVTPPIRSVGQAMTVKIVRMWGSTIGSFSATYSVLSTGNDTKFYYCIPCVNICVCVYARVHTHAMLC